MPMNNTAKTLTIISIAVSVIGILQANLFPLSLNGGYGQNLSTVATASSTSSSVANATTYDGGNAIAISGSAPSNSITITNTIKQTPVNPTLPRPIAKQRTKDETITSAINDDGTVHLVISATGSQITILEGDPNFAYSGAVISAVAAKQVVFLPRGQPLVVSLSGTGAQLNIARSISKQVTVNNSGVGAEVSVF